MGDPLCLSECKKQKSLILVTGVSAEMKQILILQPNLDQSIAIAKYIKKYSNRYHVVGGYEKNIPISGRFSCYDEMIIVPSDRNVISKDYDLIIPTGAKSTYQEITQRGTIQIGNIKYDKANLVVFDKIKTLKTVGGIGVPVPATYSDLEEVSEYPVFYKQDFERGGGARGVIKDKTELVKISDNSGLIYQEFIDSPFTYGVAFLAHEGHMLTSFIQKELLSYPRPGGSGVVLTTVEDPRLIEYAERIIQRLNLSGWGLVEFKYCPKRDDYVFMEVNAKFWASIELAFMNNSTFLKELFDINYTAPKITSIIFMDRLAKYGAVEYVQASVKYKDFYKLNLLKSISQLPLEYLRGIKSGLVGLKEKMA